MHKPDKTQSGIALIMFLTIFLLGATAILLSRLNNRTSIMLENQAQTAQALAQAKEALIGYAATYAETHSVHEIQQGFLPCPDYNGKGSANSVCGNAGESVIGRFPWRTLGLPPLRDGSGECLWYAVSGTYKNKPKKDPPLITNDTDGLFIVQNADDVAIAGYEDQAIAIIFAPGKAVIGENEDIQKRDTTGNTTICGENAQIADYLDYFKKDENGIQIEINNATAIDTLPSTFIQAPLTKQQDAEGKVDKVKVVFNDTLMLITPKDFKPVYERMNYWIAKQVAQCLEEYGKQYTRKILSQYATEITAYETIYATQIADYNTQHSTEIVECGVQCGKKIVCQPLDCNSKCQSECATASPECTTCQSECTLENTARQNECDNCNLDCVEPLTTIKKYPWASKLDSLPVAPTADYPDRTNMRFGRIPDILTNSQNSDNEMSLNWATLNGELCLKRDYGTENGLDNHEWGWWEKWREEVFFAVDEYHEPSATTYIWVKNNSRETLCTLSRIIATPSRISECPVNNGNLPSNQLTINSTRKQSLVVMVAGRKLKLPSLEQKRTSPEEKKNINNYLEPDNIPLSRNFISQWATDDFNDAVCGIGDIESSGEISCVNP